MENHNWIWLSFPSWQALPLGFKCSKLIVLVARLPHKHKTHPCVHSTEYSNTTGNRPRGSQLLTIYSWWGLVLAETCFNCNRWPLQHGCPACRMRCACTFLNNLLLVLVLDSGLVINIKCTNRLMFTILKNTEGESTTTYILYSHKVQSCILLLI